MVKETDEMAENGSSVSENADSTFEDNQEAALEEMEENFDQPGCMGSLSTWHVALLQILKG